MDPTEIMEGVDRSASPADGKAQRLPQPPLQVADAVSMVVENDDLLRQIMVCLGLPTSLVRAILVCKHWFFVASDPFFIHRFRCRHPPRLLGFYVATRSTTSFILLRPRFVPMPPDELPQELAPAVRMVESYSLDVYEEDFACVCDLQNDTMLVSGFYGKHTDTDGRRYVAEVHWPMSPQRGVVPVPVIEYDQFECPTCTAAQFLLKVQDQGGRNRLVYVCLSMGFLRNIKEHDYSVKYKAHIYVLQENAQWRFRSSATAVLPSPKSDSKPLLAGTKVYLEHCTSIAVLDLKTSIFSTIPLPEGMERYDYKDMMLSASYDSGIFLIHLDENLQLFIWLHIGGGRAPDWLLLDVVDLPEMFETLGMSGWTDDGDPATLFQTPQTGDFIDFVFLKLGKCAFCYDPRRRVLRKVYEVTQEDQTLELLHPIMMTWPPNFPALKRDHLARCAFSFLNNFGDL